MASSFAPPSTTSTAASQPMPPLPNLQTAPTGAEDPQGGMLASLMSGIAPVKSGVDAINAACKQIVQSGVIPGSEQVCGQIVALATSLLPMAAQSLMGSGAPSPGSATPPMGPSPMG